jgi:signal recognition particle receptor subunit beta
MGAPKTDLGHPLTLVIFDGDDSDLRALSAILILAGSALKTPWRLTWQEPADVALVVVDPSFEASRWQECLERYPVERLIAFSEEGWAPPEAHWRLSRYEPGHPPSLRAFTQLLNQIADHRALQSDRESREDLPSGIASGEGSMFSPDVFVPETRLLGLLQKFGAEGKACRIGSAEGLEAYVIPGQDTFLSRATIEELLPLCIAECPDLQVEAVEESETVTRLIAQGYRKCSLTELIWFAALAGSQGRLLAGCRPEEPVHLRQWPDFARLPYYSDYQELASQMAKQAATLAEVAAAAAVPLGQAIDFHNACVALGLIKRGAAAIEHLQKKTLCRECMSHAFSHLAKEGQWQRVVKVLITGSVGAGKTTSILESSDSVPVMTEARPSDQVSDMKATTTVAMDYGEMFLSCGVKVQLLGTPGQRRFEFMGQILCRSAWGLVVLIDHSAPDPLGELAYYLELYREFLPSLQLAIAVTRYERDAAASLEPYRAVLKERGVACTLDFLDPRQASNLFDLLARMAKISYVSGSRRSVSRR